MRLDLFILIIYIYYCIKNHKKGLPLDEEDLSRLPDVNCRTMLHFCRFRHIHMQDAIFELRINAGLIDIVDVEGTAYGAHAALPADVIALVVLITGFTLLLSSYGEITVLIAELYILFLHARQICRQLIAVTVILHIDPHTAIGIEARHGGEEIIMEKWFIEHIPDAARSIACCQIFTTAKRNQTKHNQQPLSKFIPVKSLLCAPDYLLTFL